MRTSTWLYVGLWVAAIGAEVVYALDGDRDLQGHALGAMLFVTVVFVLYRAATRGRRARDAAHG